MRTDNRQLNQLREITISRNYTKYAEGSVLIAFGNTKVLCTASIVDGVPKFLRGAKQGWLTAEYGMLPSATHIRTMREAKRGQQTGRTQEIQRLIGRTLRNAINLHALNEQTITIDCDVIQADGGTRTAAITGSYIALYDLLKKWQTNNNIQTIPLHCLIASVSVGIFNGEAILDLNYDEDFNADIDMNVVMTDQGKFVEIQGTAEGLAFSSEQLTQMLELAKQGIDDIINLQKQALNII